MEQENAKPKTHGTNNIYIDAAIEALEQAANKDNDLSFMLIIENKKSCGFHAQGNILNLASAISHIAKTNKNLSDILDAVNIIRSMENSSPKERLRAILDKGDALIEKWLDELRKNKPNP